MTTNSPSSQPSKIDEEEALPYTIRRQSIDREASPVRRHSTFLPYQPARGRTSPNPNGKADRQPGQHVADEGNTDQPHRRSPKTGACKYYCIELFNFLSVCTCDRRIFVNERPASICGVPEFLHRCFVLTFLIVGETIEWRYGVIS